MKHTEWTIYRARRLWAAIFLGQALLFALMYGLTGKYAFFLIGPFCVFNLAIDLFPYWYTLMNETETSRGSKFQQFQRLAREIFPEGTKLDLRLQESDFANLMVFSHRRTVWITSSVGFIENFSEAELRSLLIEIKTLYTLGRLRTATLLAALQTTLPLGIWRHNRGSELIFFSQNQDIQWQQLNFKVFHWSDGKRSAARMPLLPCLVYPALTNYNPSSYFSVYSYLRERLITALKTEEIAHGK